MCYMPSTWANSTGLPLSCLPLTTPLQLCVRAVGLNFRDVLNVLGMYPGDPGPPGADFAGVVAAAGPGVHTMAAGTREQCWRCVAARCAVHLCAVPCCCLPLCQHTVSIHFASRPYLCRGGCVWSRTRVPGAHSVCPCPARGGNANQPEL